MTTARSVRSILKPVHTWAGLVSGIVLALVSLTGSLVVFRAEFAKASLSSAVAANAAVERIDLDQAAKETARFWPDSRIRRVQLARDAADPYIFQLQSEGRPTERVAVDAHSGRVLGTVQTGAMDWLVDLHRNLLSGKTGRKAVGIAGVVLFLLGATGLLMWLWGARNWSAWVSLRRSGSTRRFSFELHRFSGLWAYAFLAVISFTGMERAFPDSFREAIKSLTGGPATVQGPKGIHSATTRSLADYVRIGSAAMPDGIPIELRLPAPGKGPVDLRLYRSGDFSPSGNHVYLDPSTASVIQVDRIVDRPIGARFLAALAPIHYGQFGGVPVKVAWVLLGLTPVLLFVTGFLAWWRPAKAKSKQRVMEQTGSADLAAAGR